MILRARIVGGMDFANVNMYERVIKNSKRMANYKKLVSKVSY